MAEVIDVVAIEPPSETGPVHWADGAVAEMQYVQDEDGIWSMAHFTKCGLNLSSASFGVTDNADDVTCSDCA